MRLCINLPTEMVSALRARAAETGVSVSVQIRQALNLAIFADAQAARKSTRMPVLFVQKTEAQ